MTHKIEADKQPLRSDGSTQTIPRGLSRRDLLACATGGALLGGGVLAGARWNEWGWRASTFIGRAETYTSDLERIITDGLAALGVDAHEVQGKSVLLKPNLVEPTRLASHVNTHPAVVRAACMAFRRLGAREVVMAEGQGHTRDSDYALEQSGFADMLASEGLDFVDLNVDDVTAVKNQLGQTRLRELMLPRTLVHRADLIVSMPKLKTHHWTGVTLSMKNLFGVMPGAFYGWPKNVLHQMGIEQSIVDINAAARPHLAIVDGVIGMEGDGPIMGSPRTAGVLILGRNLPAVDATASRLMGIDPGRIGYLAWSAGRLGAISEAHIEQRGEPIASCTQTFQHLNEPTMKTLVGSYRA